jgi:uncharacterized protein involved in outer membrane biogenesis
MPASRGQPGLRGQRGLRGLRWLLAGLALLVAVAVLGVWLLPSMLDWNRYRATITELASERVGRPVRIDGPISLVLLPHPTLTAGQVSLSGDRGTVTAAQLRLQVALGPLLAGRIDARDLVLRGLDVTLPWSPGAGPGLLAKVAPDWLSHVSARIEGGRLAIGRLVLTDIDATLATSDATGTYMVAGTAKSGAMVPVGAKSVGGKSGGVKPGGEKAAAGTVDAPKAGAAQGWQFTARLTRPGGDGAVGLDLAVDGLGRLAGLGGSIAGQVGSNGMLTGRITGRGPDLSQVLPAPAVPFRAQGRVNIAGGLAVADQLTGEIGGAPTSGAVALRLDRTPRLDVAMTASRLDLDAWAPALLRAVDGADGMGGLPIGIDISAEAATLGGGTLRRLRGAFDIADGMVVVREARAVLPGDATFRLSGRVLPAGAPTGGLRLDGTASVWAPALRTTLAWGAAQGGEDDGLPPGALRSLRLSGHVVADAAGVAVDRMTGVLDGGPVAGAMSLRLGPKPLLLADLSVDQLDLGAWVPDAPPSPSALLARLAQVVPGAARVAPGMALEVKLRAPRALLHGVTLAPLSFDLGVDGGRLALHGASFGVGGMEGTLSGTLLEGGRLADGRLDLQAAHATALATLLPGLIPGFTADLRGPVAPLLAGLMRAPIWLGPVNLQVQAAGTAAALGATVAGSLGDLRIDAQPTLDLSGPAWRWQGPLTLRHPGAPRLAVALGMGAAPDWLGDGSLSLVAQVAAGASGVGLKDFTLTAGGLHATGELDLRLDAPGGPSLTGKVMADQLPLPAPAGGDPLPLGALAGWQASVRLEAARVLAGSSVVLHKAVATVALADGTLRLEGVTAQLGGGALTLRASLDASAPSPLLAMQGSLTGADLTGPLLDQPFDLTAGTLDAKLTLASHGFSPDALLAGMTGGLSVTVRGGALSGLDLPGVVAALSDPAGPDDPALRKALDGGSMGFDSLDVKATLAQGVVQLEQARMSAPSGGIDITGNVSLPDSRLDLRLLLRPALPRADGGAAGVRPPGIGLRITGTPGRPQRAPELADIIRWRAEPDR